MDTTKRTIKQWLEHVSTGHLRLPNFQRKTVWKSAQTIKLLETIIRHPNRPIGTLLTLETDPDNPHFPSRLIEGSTGDTEKCRELLLDGQQRLTALSKALNDADDKFRYYAEWKDDYTEISKIKQENKKAKDSVSLFGDHKKQFKKRCFPVHLLNPLEDSQIVKEWAGQLTSPSDRGNVEKLIIKTRKKFERKGRIIPYFQLERSVERNTAIEVYKTINTNSVKLSDYYLAVAQMEKETKKSLYDMADRLEKKVSTIADIETDEIGELILKIFCLTVGRLPSGGAYKSLNYEELIKQEENIFNGIEWAVEKLAEIKIWHGKQLPSIVPLRVLPALHVKLAKDGEKIDTPARERIINKYLWHTFLTDHYSNQANQKLKKDFYGLADYFLDAGKEDDIPIFKDVNKPSQGDIETAQWPHETAKSTLSRGILLICCYHGAETLTDGKKLNQENFKDREKHHIFPQSKDLDNNIAINCMLIPGDENRDFTDDWPGDYIKKLFSKDSRQLVATAVVNSLETHCIPIGIAETLMEATQNNKDKKIIDIDDVFQNFLTARAEEVNTRIEKLLRYGKI